MKTHPPSSKTAKLPQKGARSSFSLFKRVNEAEAAKSGEISEAQRRNNAVLRAQIRQRLLALSPEELAKKLKEDPSLEENLKED